MSYETTVFEYSTEMLRLEAIEHDSAPFFTCIHMYSVSTFQYRLIIISTKLSTCMHNMGQLSRRCAIEICMYA